MTALSEDELDLVRASFRDFAAGGEAGAAAFYDRLFAVTPGLRGFFPQEMTQQCAKLMSMLGIVVAQLHDHAALRPLLADLARRQLGYTELTAPFDGWIEKRGIEAGVVVAPAVPVFTLRSAGAVWANLGVAEVDVGKVRIGQTVEVRVPATGAAPQQGTVEAIVPHADMLSRAFTVKVRLDNPRGDLKLPGSDRTGA